MLDDDAVRAGVLRLSRAHPSGGRVVERAAVMAAGAAAGAMMAWVVEHGRPEAMPDLPSAGGLHGARAAASDARRPLRYVLPVSAVEPRSD